MRMPGYTKPTDRNAEDGFSLVELLIAISLLSFGLLSTATMLTNGIVANRFAQRLSVETNVAYSVVDELMSLDTGDVLFDAATNGAVYDLDAGSIATARTVQGVSYSSTYSIVPNSPVTGVASISVTVAGGGRSVTISSSKRTL